jgi:hypothetical protein
VYRARDTRLKCEVALKVPPDAFAQDADPLARLRREAELLARAQSPEHRGRQRSRRIGRATAIILELVKDRRSNSGWDGLIIWRGGLKTRSVPDSGSGRGFSPADPDRRSARHRETDRGRWNRRTRRASSYTDKSGSTEV